MKQTSIKFRNYKKSALNSKGEKVSNILKTNLKDIVDEEMYKLIKKYFELKECFRSRGKGKRLPSFDFITYRSYIEYIQYKGNISNNLYELSHQSLLTTVGNNWLNDEVLNAYIKLILERSLSEGCFKTFIFSTYFFQQFQTLGIDKTISYFEKKKLELEKYEIILIPFNIGYHWSLIQINMQNLSILYYDSLKSVSKCIIEPILNLFKNIHKKNDQTDDINWTISTVSCPKQENTNDCGVFVLRYMENISQNTQFNFSQEDMEYLRVVIGIELVKGELLRN